MHRSPIPTLAFLFVAIFAAAVFAQANPASPSPQQGLPQQPTATPAPAQPSPKQSDVQQAPGSEPSKSGAQQPDGGRPSGQQKSSKQQGTATPAVAATPPPPAAPKTEILDSSATSGALTTDGHDPILDPAPVPATITTLVGGTISAIDRMRNKLSVQVFGGNRWTINFDERTHIFHNGAETTQLALKKGERVYIDTQ